MTTLKKGDFVEVEYTGMLKDGREIFDTTDEKKARELKIHNTQALYGLVTICLGEHQVIKAVDDYLIGKDSGKTYSFEVKPEDGFGKKNPKLLKVVATTMFRKQQIEPMPGLQVTVDGVLGTIRTVTGGRCVLDLNHPLSGRELMYEVKVHDIVTDKKKQVESYLRIALGLKDIEVSVANDEATVVMPSALPKDISDMLGKRCSELSGIRKIEFKKKEAKKDIKHTLPEQKA
jgi:FKBP-type peptidyl-prolyl cis-trans isomerase 2